MINEKLKIRPADISNMSNVSASNEINYVVWFFHTQSIGNFLKNANLCEDENVVVIDQYVELIVLSDDEFEKNSCYLTGTKYSLFCSSLNKEELATYLKNEVTCDYLHDIKKHRKQDHNISVVNESVCFEKLKIRPVNVSDLQDISNDFVIVNPNTIKYNDVVPGYVLYIRGEDHPFVCLDGESTEKLGLSAYSSDSRYFLVNRDYERNDLTYIEMLDYVNSFSKDEMNDYYDIEYVCIPYTLKQQFDDRFEFFQYYRQLKLKPEILQIK